MSKILEIMGVASVCYVFTKFEEDIWTQMYKRADKHAYVDSEFDTGQENIYFRGS